MICSPFTYIPEVVIKLIMETEPTYNRLSKELFTAFPVSSEIMKFFGDTHEVADFLRQFSFNSRKLLFDSSKMWSVALESNKVFFKIGRVMNHSLLKHSNYLWYHVTVNIKDNEIENFIKILRRTITDIREQETDKFFNRKTKQDFTSKLFPIHTISVPWLNK